MEFQWKYRPPGVPSHCHVPIVPLEIPCSPLPQSTWPPSTVYPRSSCIEFPQSQSPLLKVPSLKSSWKCRITHYPWNCNVLFLLEFPHSSFLGMTVSLFSPELPCSHSPGIVPFAVLPGKALSPVSLGIKSSLKLQILGLFYFKFPNQSNRHTYIIHKKFQLKNSCYRRFCSNFFGYHNTLDFKEFVWLHTCLWMCNTFSP